MNPGKPEGIKHPFWKRILSFIKARIMPSLNIEGIRVYQAEWMRGHGLALPPIGIFVGPDHNPELIRHEFGHILQFKKRKFLGFYFQVGIPSVLNLVLLKLEKRILGRNRFIPPHSELKVEKEANEMSMEYFKPLKNGFNRE
jgi:hypothetical protein